MNFFYVCNLRNKIDTHAHNSGKALNFTFPIIEPIKVLTYFTFLTIEWSKIDMSSDEPSLINRIGTNTTENFTIKTSQTKAIIATDDPKLFIKSTNNPDEVVELSSEDMKRVEIRFAERRARMVSICRRQGHDPPENIDELLPKSHPFLLNQIFHDSDMSLSGCLPPKTGSTSWNHFWWGFSKYDGSSPGQFDSFQSQGNRYIRKWEQTLKQQPPKVLFLTVRHPIDRLLSGWNNILCNKNCRNADRIRYSKQALSVSFNSDYFSRFYSFD